MLLSLQNSRIPFRTNAKFVLFLIPAQLIVFALIYHLPFQDVTSWSRPLHKIGWRVSVGWGLSTPPSDPPPKWSGEDDPAMVGALVAGVLNISEVGWMGDFTSNWTTHVTDVNNITAHFNKGHETMVYLEHILDHWDTLAPVTLFIHGHLDSWHQDWPMDEILRTLNLTVVEQEGFVNLRCAWEHGCPNRITTITDFEKGHIITASEYSEEFLIMKGVTEVFPIFFPGEALPEILASPCCAQFAVTREAIWARGREVYEKMRDWMVETRYNDHVSGTIVERLWAYILRGPDEDSVFCMSPQFCRCKLYNKCAPPPPLFEYSGPVGYQPARVRFKIQQPKEEEQELEPESPKPEDNTDSENTEKDKLENEGNKEKSGNEEESKVDVVPLKELDVDYTTGRPVHKTEFEAQRMHDKLVADHQAEIEADQLRDKLAADHKAKLRDGAVFAKVYRS